MDNLPSAEQIGQMMGVKIGEGGLARFARELVALNPAVAEQLQNWCQAQPDLKRIVTVDTNPLYDTVILLWTAAGLPPDPLQTLFSLGLGEVDPVLALPKTYGQTNFAGRQQDANTEFVAEAVCVEVWGDGTAYEALTNQLKARLVESVIRSIAYVVQRANAAPTSYGPGTQMLHGLVATEYSTISNISIVDISAIALPTDVSFSSPERARTDWMELDPPLVIGAGTGLRVELSAIPGNLQSAAGLANARVFVRMYFRGFTRRLIPN